jgi:hypothetical protein
MTESGRKIVKLAVIRKNDDTPCPFGLSIPFACNNAGKVIERMAPLDILGPEASDEDKQTLGKANLRLLVWTLMSGQEPARCTYASHVFPDKSAVDCNYGDTAPGQTQSSALLGSPFYSQLFTGISLDGLYSYPLGFYGDYNISRNLFYGLYSLQGHTKIPKEQLKKLAAEAVRLALEERDEG